MALSSDCAARRTRASCIQNRGGLVVSIVVVRCSVRRDTPARRAASSTVWLSRSTSRTSVTSSDRAQQSDTLRSRFVVELASFSTESWQTVVPGRRPPAGEARPFFDRDGARSVVDVGDEPTDRLIRYFAANHVAASIGEHHRVSVGGGAVRPVGEDWIHEEA